MATLAGVVVARPGMIRAQQSAPVRRVGVLLSGEAGGAWQEGLNVFRRTLGLLGWREGENLSIDLQWGGHTADTLDVRAGLLAVGKPDVVLVGPTNALKAIRPHSSGIPLVFVLVSDPLGQGIVDSLARPSGNATGFTNLEFSMLGKWLDILKEIVPRLSRVGLMIHVSNASSQGWFQTFKDVAPKAGVTPIAMPVQSVDDVNRAVALLADQPDGGLIVPGDSFLSTPQLQAHVIGLTARHRLPALSARHEFAVDGGLVSYGIEELEPFRLAAGYVDRILKGDKPSDLPVQQPTRFRFTINLKSAKAIGLTVPLTLQVAADEVIE